MDPEDASTTHNQTRTTPLPKYQLALTLLIQSSEAITATVIYPFIAQLVRSTGITNGDETKVGYYAGVIESIFFISESLLVFQWGRAADRYGRRPILLLGPLGLGVAMLGFGLSRTFWPLVVFRAAQGVFNGNVGVSKTVLAEITDDTNRASAFTMIPIMWTFGVTLGPTIGGYLAEPAKTWPSVFGKLQFFVDYPYFLPCFVAGLYAFITFIIPFFGLKETLASMTSIKAEREVNAEEESAPLLGSTPGSTEPEPNYGSTQHTALGTDSNDAPTKVSSTKLLNPALTITLVNYFLFTFSEMSYSALIPLLYSTSPVFGGLGFSARTIGTIMASFSFINAFIQIFLLKDLPKKLGAKRTYTLCYTSLLVAFGMLMVEQLLVRHGWSRGWIWAAIVVQLGSVTFMYPAYTSISILIVETATPGTLGAVNGLAQAGASGFRGLGPSVASSLYALSLHSGLLGGYLVYAVMASVVLAGTACSLMLPTPRKT
ncbi:hypothetical protein VNI00_010796 [Paramarasmius palmivorus]|uniref:Major facilitator superfamily (MFS) profile domain-containing protein n=1 Tax=Paramarasmius palmivorus TaxID=297713 RepID=A0AAW0CHW8_9AGAR